MKFEREFEYTYEYGETGPKPVYYKFGNQLSYNYPYKTCGSLCSNGYVSGTEQCDDGNALNGDGCSSSCVLEGTPTCYTN